MRILLSLLILFTITLVAQANTDKPPSVIIEPDTEAGGIPAVAYVGVPFEVHVKATNGQAPWKWKVKSTEIPEPGPNGSSHFYFRGTPTAADLQSGKISFTVACKSKKLIKGSLSSAIAIQAAPQKDFVLRVAPTHLELSQGQEASIVLNLEAVNGFNDTVDLTADSDLDYWFDHTLMRVGETDTLLIRTNVGTPVESHTVTIYATSGAIRHNLALSVDVSKCQATAVTLPDVAFPNQFLKKPFAVQITAAGGGCHGVTEAKEDSESSCEFCLVSTSGLVTGTPTRAGRFFVAIKAQSNDDATNKTIRQYSFKVPMPAVDKGVKVSLQDEQGHDLTEVTVGQSVVIAYERSDGKAGNFRTLVDLINTAGDTGSVPQVVEEITDATLPERASVRWTTNIPGICGACNPDTYVIRVTILDKTSGLPVGDSISLTIHK